VRDGVAIGVQEGLQGGNGSMMNYGSLGKQQYPVNAGEDLEAGLVDGEDDGSVAREASLFENLHDFEGGSAVKPRGGFVEE